MPSSLSETAQALTTSPVVAAMTSNAGLTMATGDAVVMGITAALNGLGQLLKQPVKFKQNVYLFPVLLVAGFLLAWWVTGDDKQAILKGALSAWNSTISYKALGPDGLGVLGRGTD